MTGHKNQIQENACAMKENGHNPENHKQDDCKNIMKKLNCPT